MKTKATIKKTIGIGLIVLLTALMAMVMSTMIVNFAHSATLAPQPMFTALDANGDPYVGGKLYTYDTGTTTPKTTWTDSTKGTPNTNPVILDSRGQADVWIDSIDGAYRFRLLDSGDVTIWTVDGIQNELDMSSLAALVHPDVADTVSIYDNSASAQKQISVLNLLGNIYYPNASAADQGLTGNSDTIKYAVDTLGSSGGIIYLRNNSGSATTAYTLGTSETIGSTVRLLMEPGALIKPAATKVLTVYSPEHIDAAPWQQIVDTTNNSTDPLAFTITGVVYPEWWGAVADGVTDDGPDIQLAINSISHVFPGKPGEIHFLQDNYFVSTEIVQVIYVTWRGFGDRSTIIYDNSRSGWLLTFALEQRFYANTFRVENMQFEIEDATGTPVGVIRVVDTIGFKLFESSIKASPTAEGIRFENNAVYCESINLRNVGVSFGTYCVRFVPSDEAAVSPARYAAVTTGSISFNQTFLENVHTHPSEGGYGFRIAGDFDRAIFSNCGGWTDDGVITGAMFQTLNELAQITFINPWLDDTSSTYRLFDFDATLTKAVIINPHGPDNFQMDIDFSGFFGLGKQFLGRLIMGKSDHPDTKGGHYLENSETSEYIHYPFDMGLNSDDYGTTGTVAVGGAVPSNVLITPDTGPAGVNFLASKFSFPNIGPGRANVEFRFSADDYTALGIYMGTSNNGVGNFISDLSSNGALQGFLITNETGGAALGANLYAVAMSTQEDDRVDLGAVSTSTFYSVKLIFYRESATNYADCYINDVYKGQLDITTIPNNSAFKANAYNAGSTGKILSVDDIIYSNNRPGR